jgi:transcriptional regulator with XRE-family HTH domain
MFNEIEMENNKIGSAIQYFRENYRISQTTLCKGLCSVPTLSRIEAGARDVDSLLLEALLERLGKTPNQFELILTDLDYEAYQSREDIKKHIEEKNVQSADSMLNLYEKIFSSKGSVHKQFIVSCRALLNEIRGGDVRTTIDLFMEAISYTVPDFKTNEIGDYYLSSTELNIIIDIIQRMLAAGMVERAKEILFRVLDYLDNHTSMAENYRFYPKVAIIACRLYQKENEPRKALELCDKGIERNFGNRKFDYRAELALIKAQTTEELAKADNCFEDMKKECKRLFIEAYYIHDFCEEYDIAEELKQHLKEVYQWDDTD